MMYTISVHFSLAKATVFKKGRKVPLHSGQTGEPDLFMSMRLMALQLSHCITITNTGLLPLEFISMYLVTAPGGGHSHPFQATRLSFLKSPWRENQGVQELQSFWKSWGGHRPPKYFLHTFLSFTKIRNRSNLLSKEKPDGIYTSRGDIIETEQRLCLCHPVRDFEQPPPGSWNKMIVNVFCFGADITYALGPFIYSGSG